MTEKAPPRSGLKQVRTLIWLLVGLSAAGLAFLLLYPHLSATTPKLEGAAAPASYGGPFTLVGADGKPFSSIRLAGKPYAIYFGFTRCGDVCPITLGRLTKLREQAGGKDAFNIMFVTIDPKNDGPEEVGQYEKAFGSPIIGLTGSQEQIDRVKKQFGVTARPAMHPMPGKEMEHSATVLLFDRGGKFISTIDSQEQDSAALAKLKRLTA